MLDALDQATRLAPIVVVGALAAYTWWLGQWSRFEGTLHRARLRAAAGHHRAI